MVAASLSDYRRRAFTRPLPKPRLRVRYWDFSQCNDWVNPKRRKWPKEQHRDFRTERQVERFKTRLKAKLGTDVIFDVVSLEAGAAE